MLNQLRANLGKQVGIELLNGSKVFGTILEVDEKALRIETDTGIANLLIDAVQIVWESQETSLSERDMEEIAEKVKDMAETRYICLGFNGFACPRTYTCRPPHACNRFFCPGFFSSAIFPPPPPDVPCQFNFFGYVRPASNKEEKDTKGKKEPKE